MKRTDAKSWAGCLRATHRRRNEVLRVERGGKRTAHRQRELFARMQRQAIAESGGETD
jgi:hypothetical protein